MPTNQPLLDWLALRFVEQGWSMKQMHRLIMLSSTYQMSSDYNAHAAEVDPENTLLWRVNRRRLEAEAIRDAVTAVTGVIDLSVGGTVLSYKDREYVSNTSRARRRRLRHAAARGVHPGGAQLDVRDVPGVRSAGPFDTQRRSQFHGGGAAGAVHDECVAGVEVHARDGGEAAGADDLDDAARIRDA